MQPSPRGYIQGNFRANYSRMYADLGFVLFALNVYLHTSLYDTHIWIAKYSLNRTRPEVIYSDDFFLIDIRPIVLKSIKILHKILKHNIAY